MKKIILLSLTLVVFSYSQAKQFTISIVDQTYNPDITNAFVGDTITIEATNSHPLVQVSKTNWQLGNATELVGGWGTKTTNYTFKIAASDTLYFMCTSHGTGGMKAKIISTVPIFGSATNVSASILHFQNPVKNKTLNITLDSPSENYTFLIYNLSVIIEFSTIIKHSESLVLSNLKSGLYYFALLSENKQQFQTQKIFIE